MPSMMDYDDYSMSKFTAAVETTVEALESRAVWFDSIVVRGVSGLIVGAVVAHQMSKPIVVVRKDSESSHTSTLVSNFAEIGNRYVVVDDFVSTGATLRAIRTEISRYAGYEPKTVEYAGCYQYLYECWHAEEPVKPALSKLADYKRGEQNVYPSDNPFERALDRYTIDDAALTWLTSYQGQRIVW